MKNRLTWRLGTFLLLILAICDLQVAMAQQPVKVEIIFMNHGPMQPVIKGLKEILARHTETVSASWYDYEKPEGQDFMRQKGIKAHIPLLIFINSSSTAQVQGRKVTFMGFPSGYGPYQFQGKWSLEDLDMLLKSLPKQP